ncbi:MAG TPA: tyrosine-type recombinase/integrase [Ktedonobacteraceae bacterium]|nr:tyrosine-type recombinase/integrase [Ktedonobacteraceae bacterium]
MANRGHGEGSIYQRSDGRWVASISLDNRKRKTFYGKTRKEVQEKLRVALNEQKQGILATGPQQTVKQYLENWLEEVHKATIRPSTYRSYRSALDNRIFPAIGHIPLQKLTAQRVQALYSQLLSSGLAEKSVRNTHGLLHKAFDNAVRWGLVSRNICDSVSQPRRIRHEIQPLTIEQARRLIEAAQGHSLEGLLTVTVATGMRLGELLALHWQDVDFEHQSLHVQRSVGYIRNQGYVESEPKTAKSRRKIALPAFVCEALKQHCTRQLARRLQVGTAWQDRDLVFCNRKGGFLDPDHLRKRFYKLLRDAHLPTVRFHDLRHSAATILLSTGVHPKVVQEILGHSQISMTLDTYSHVLPSMQEEAMHKLDDAFRDDKLDDASGEVEPS